MKISLGGIPLDIVITAEGMDNTVGMFVPDHYVIKIHPDYPPASQTMALWHELIHAALYLSGQSARLGDTAEESIVLALEHLLFPLIDHKRLDRLLKSGV